MLKKTDILGVSITTSKEEEILEYLLDVLVKRPKSDEKELPSERKVVIFTPNPEQISAATKNSQLRNLLNQAQISLPDGMGVVWAARLLGKPIYARITGVDFMGKLVERMAEQPVMTGFLGGQEGVAESVAFCLQKKWPKLRVAYASATYNREKLRQSDVDILFVALGFPKQEQWVVDHMDEVPAKVLIVVGGAFDFISGKVARAPKVFRTVGLEWLFRLILEPRRFRRQLKIWNFGCLIMKEALMVRIAKMVYG